MLDKRVLITGATGFVGLRLVELLALRKDTRIYAVCRRVNDQLASIQAVNKNITVIENCDLTQRAAYEQLPQRVNYVLHCMGLAKFQGADRRELYRSNVVATKLLMEYLCNLSEIPIRVVYLSSIGVHDRKYLANSSELIKEDSDLSPSTYYGKTKLLGEKAVKESSIPSIICRLGWVYGPGMRRASHVRYFAEKCRHRALFSRVDFSGQVMAVYIDDACRALLSLTFSQKPIYATYLVVGDKPVAIGNIFRLVRELTDDDTSFLISRVTLKLTRWFSRILSMKLRTVLEKNYLAASSERLNKEGIHLDQDLKEGLKKSITLGRWFDNEVT